MDFGLARVNTSDMTQDGIVLGTPNYMSPEQALGDKVDGRSDLFSAGAVLYELLTSHKPFEADSTPSVLFQVVHRQPPPVKRWAPDVPTPSGGGREPGPHQGPRRPVRHRRRRCAPPSTRPAQGRAQSVPELRPPASRRTRARARGGPPLQVRLGLAAPAATGVEPRACGAARRSVGERSGLPALGVGAALALIVVLFLAGPWLRDRIWPRPRAPPTAPPRSASSPGPWSRPRSSWRSASWTTRTGGRR